MVVTVHVATSLDGRIARHGRTTLLSSDEGRRSAHRARAANDAVLVGSGTIRIDDPLLTVREVAGRNPLRVVLATSLDVAPSARVFADKHALVVGARGARNPRLEAEVALVEEDHGMVAVGPLLELLAARGVERLLVEGGSRVLTSFFRGGFVDRLEVEVAATMLGDPATPLIGMLETPPRLHNVAIAPLGTSVLIQADVARS